MRLVRVVANQHVHRSTRPNLQSALLVAALLISTTLAALAAERPRIVFSRLAPARSGLFLADADGKNERPLMPATGLDNNASLSADGKWVIFTSERGASADIYRVASGRLGARAAHQGAQLRRSGGALA